MITENLSTLKIHKLTQAQYDRELSAGNIDENALYLTPDATLIVKLSTHDYQEFYSSHSYEDIIQAFNNKKIINLLLDEYVFVLDAQYPVVDGEALNFVSQVYSSDFESNMCAIRKLLFKSDNSIEFSGNPIYLTDIDTVVSLIDDSKILMISVIYDDSQDLYILSHSVEEIKNAHNENKIIYAYYEGITYPFTYIESDVITFETYDSNGYHRLNIYYDEELEQSVVDIIFDENGRLVNDWELEGRFEEVNEQIAGITYEQIGAAPAGYGFGEKEAQAMNWNSHYRSGIYKEKANSPDGAALWYGLTCVSYYGESADLAFNPDETNGFTMAVRHQKNGTYQEWEYVNPPLNSGVIYRTTERQYGLPVYKKIENGTLYYSIDKGVTWKPYNQFVNAAPAGYGLGGHGRTATDFNECILSGFYSSATTGAINGPKEWDNMKYGVLLVENRDGPIIYQRLTYESYSAMRWSNDIGTTWSDWYWETPPYETGKVYKTTKRYRMMTLYERVNPDTFIIEYSTNYSIAEDGTESGTWYNYAQLFGLSSYIDTKIEETILGGSW